MCKAATLSAPVDSEYLEVPVSDSDSDSAGASDSEPEEPDKQTAAEIRAYAKIMLHGRSRNDILEAGYHRYAFHDERVPVWLADDERRHLRWAPASNHLDAGVKGTTICRVKDTNLMG